MMYIYSDDNAGQSLLSELVGAAHRGVRVKIIIDAFGSLFTAHHFFDPLREAGGEIHRFNDDWRLLYFFRNHQKFVISDSTVALIGGFNIAEHYFSDGIENGWCEIGLRVQDAAVATLQAYFDRIWGAHSQKPLRLRDLIGFSVEEQNDEDELEWLVGSPGIRRSPYANSLRRDLARAHYLSVLMAYFVPSASLRRLLGRIARRGKVRLVLPHATDVPISRYAAWHTYKRLLSEGCEIYEYLPRPLHAKLLVIDDVVYVGSANIDFRSLHLNFEMTLRIQNAELAAEARELIHKTIGLSQRITQEVYDQNSGLLQRFIQRASYLLLSRFDFLISRKFVK
jgi:cardiolipin synthase